ncbi:RNA polymerase sigma factor SigJ [Paenibacillus monticola]|uniref:Sigma-70 family RNA polymerase sigma factor n=1 Tax=Paenibacillus monticola TaxID=2666075 RepID=A0A7X2H5Q1_9BACL|nr:RNA polymerase sigma factor SigJ [Paenibacillus monticola]MRN53223.1 sigma-70 family RNA polymerase sigma factor [Paenibacillus monticola]
MEQHNMEELYLSYQKYAFSIAYRMLGVVADAEDVVQDCFAELQRRDRTEILNIKAYLAKGITNRCLNMLHSAHNQRETYIGEWLPEPVTDTFEGPEAIVERNETLSYAFLVLLEQFTPTERAVFVLREVFQYEYEAIAEMVDKSEANCRKIFSRAKRNLQPVSTSDRRSSINEPARKTLLKRFTAAFAAYDVNRVLELLADHPVLIADGGGGEVHTILRPMVGRKGVVALLTSRRVLDKLRNWESSFALINGESNIVFTHQGKVTGVLCLNLDGEHIQDLYLIMDPDKLSHIVI